MLVGLSMNDSEAVIPHSASKKIAEHSKLLKGIC